MRMFQSLIARTKNHRPMLAGVFLVVFASLVIGLLLSSKSHFFTRDDSATYFLPAYVLNWQAVVEHGELAHINFHQYLGHTHLATGQPGVLYPPVYLGLALSQLLFDSLDYTIDILATLHLLAAALAMFLLLRQLQVRQSISIAAALLWITYPYVLIIARSWVSMAYTVMFLPLTFWLLQRMIERPTWQRATGLGLMNGLFFLQGNVQFMVMTVLWQTVYLFVFLFRYCTTEDRWVRLKRYVLSGVVTFFVVTPLLLPLLYAQAVSVGRYGKIHFSNFVHRSFSLPDLLLAQFFYFRDGILFHAGGQLTYVGIPLLSLFGLYFLDPLRKLLRKQQGEVFGFLMFWPLVMSTVAAGLIYFVPVLNMFSMPAKYFTFFLFFLTVAVALLVHNSYQVLKKLYAHMLFGALVLSVIFNIVIALFMPDVRSSLAPFQLAKPAETIVEAIRKEPGRIVTLWVTTGPRENIGRFLTFNFATLNGLYHFGGYDPLVSRVASKLSLDLYYSNIIEDNALPEALGYVSNWSARYFITENTLLNRDRLAKFAGVSLMKQVKDVLLYKNENAKPFAYLLGQPDSIVPVVFHVNDLVIEANTEVTDTLVLTIAPQPWYRLFINNEPVGYAPTDKAPVELVLPAGTETVKLQYVNYPFLAGVGVSVVGLFAALLVLLIRLYKQKT